MIPTFMLVLTLGMSDSTVLVPRAADPWLGPDKVKHVVVAFAAQSGSYATLRMLADHRGALVGASVMTLGLSLLKEHRDRASTGFSLRDLAWDAAGIVAASVIVANTPRR